MQQQPGAPLEVIDDVDITSVLLPKATLNHLRDVCREMGDVKRAALRGLIQDGIDSGPGIPAERLFAELRAKNSAS